MSAHAADWLPGILQCPLCGGQLEPAPATETGSQTLHCVGCGYAGWRVGRRFHLLPLNLDAAAHAEDTHRRTVLGQWADQIQAHDSARVRQAQLLNILTSYWVTSQYFFMRDHFAKRYRLRGRGLELGAGPGHASSFINLLYPETQMVTSDVAPVNMELAEDLARRLDLGADYFVVCDAAHLPFVAGAFDFIYSSAMLHHLVDIPSAVRQAGRVLRPGGVWYAVSEIAMGTVMRRMWLSRFGEQGRVSRTLGIRENNYTYRQWHAFFEQNGFQVLESTFHRDPAHHLLSWSRALYYTLAARLPEFLFRAGVPSELGFVLRKV
jgi:ubiquinone/menaquinone biosynthesis C-methylase UbiE